MLCVHRTEPARCVLQPEPKTKPRRGAAARQPELDYLSYLQTFDRLFEIPKHKKMLPAYKRLVDIAFVPYHECYSSI